MIDIGVNLTNRSFADMLVQVVHEARDAGITSMIITGTCESSSEQALTLAQAHGLFSTAGIHPHDAKDASKDFEAKLEKLCESREVVAIGECGLDFNRNFSPKDEQLEVFERQLQLGTSLGKTIFLHERDAFKEQLFLLKKYQTPDSYYVSHCFTGAREQMEAYLELGCYIGITGWLCDERRGSELREAVKYLPLDRLLLETDAPYLLPRNYRPKPKRSLNLPKYLPHIAKEVALIKQIDVEDIIKTSLENTIKAFKLELRTDPV